MSTKYPPTLEQELHLTKQGYQVIVGVDEAGCGALAGPVLAGAVVLPLDCDLQGVRDSKLITERMREELYPLITQQATAWAVGSASVEEIFTTGIRQATYLAMRRAIGQIKEVDHVLVDAWTIPELAISQQGIIRGDQTVKSIAAASIIAKVTRDRQMFVYHEQYPKYEFAKHKGYGTKKHQEMIALYGPCPIHRLGYKTFHNKIHL
jgi:ribonuclease HII